MLKYAMLRFKQLFYVILMILGSDHMYREIEEKLKQWKHQTKKKPLIIKGARQTGKTYSIRKFAEDNYKTIIEINFERDLAYIDLFKRTRNPKEILSYIELDNLDKEFIADDTLLFFDEIQASGDALTALKFLAENCPYDIICSGSMLGIAVASSTSFPVGYVETWEMVPMNFIEFLLALGVTKTWLDKLFDSYSFLTPIEPVLHNQFNHFFDLYVICGGMPEAVQKYVDTQSHAEVLRVQRRIVSDYLNDMVKYAPANDKIKVRECFASLPLQLSKENKKFQYKLVKKGYNARYFDTSLKWLEDSGLIIKVNRLSGILNPLEMGRELSIFKIYMADTGLLISQFDNSIVKDIIIGKLDVFKGMLYENIGAQILKSAEKNMYYYEPNNSAEIDFIIHYEGNVTPIEVKAGLRTRSTSFTKFVDDYKCVQAYRFSKKNIGTDASNALFLPYYLLPFVLKKEKKLI